MMVILMIAFNCQALNWKPHSDGWLGGLKMPGEDVMTMVVIFMMIMIVINQSPERHHPTIRPACDCDCHDDHVMMIELIIL